MALGLAAAQLAIASAVHGTSLPPPAEDALDGPYSYYSDSEEGSVGEGQSSAPPSTPCLSADVATPGSRPLGAASDASGAGEWLSSCSTDPKHGTARRVASSAHAASSSNVATVFTACGVSHSPASRPTYPGMAYVRKPKDACSVASYAADSPADSTSSCAFSACGGGSSAEGTCSIGVNGAVYATPAPSAAESAVLGMAQQLSDVATSAELRRRLEDAEALALAEAMKRQALEAELLRRRQCDDEAAAAAAATAVAERAELDRRRDAKQAALDANQRQIAIELAALREEQQRAHEAAEEARGRLASEAAARRASASRLELVEGAVDAARREKIRAEQARAKAHQLRKEAQQLHCLLEGMMLDDEEAEAAAGAAMEAAASGTKSERERKRRPRRRRTKRGNPSAGDDDEGAPKGIEHPSFRQVSLDAMLQRRASLERRGEAHVDAEAPAATADHSYEPNTPPPLTAIEAPSASSRRASSGVSASRRKSLVFMVRPEAERSHEALELMSSGVMRHGEAIDLVLPKGWKPGGLRLVAVLDDGRRLSLALPPGTPPGTRLVVSSETGQIASSKPPNHDGGDGVAHNGERASSRHKSSRRRRSAQSARPLDSPASDRSELTDNSFGADWVRPSPAPSMTDEVVLPAPAQLDDSSFTSQLLGRLSAMFTQ